MQLRAGLVRPGLAAARTTTRDLVVAVRPHELEAAVAHAARRLRQLGDVLASVEHRPRAQLALALPRPRLRAAVDLAGDFDRLEMVGPLEAALAQPFGWSVVELVLAPSLASASLVGLRIVGCWFGVGSRLDARLGIMLAVRRLVLVTGIRVLALGVLGIGVLVVDVLALGLDWLVTRIGVLALAVFVTSLDNRLTTRVLGRPRPRTWPAADAPTRGDAAELGAATSRCACTPGPCRGPARPRWSFLLRSTDRTAGAAA